MEKLKDAVEVHKIDIEHDTEFVGIHGVQSVPTVIFFGEDNQETGRFVGARTEEWVRDFIKEME